MPPKSKPRLKIGTARLASLSEIVLPPPPTFDLPERKGFHPMPDLDVIRHLTALNHQLSTSAADISSQCTVLKERVEMLESTVGQNRDFVTNLRGRLSSLTFAFPDEDRHEFKDLNEITSDTVIDYLQNRPIVLEAFLSADKDIAFSEIPLLIEDSARPLFVEYSLKQLNRASAAYVAVDGLFARVEANDFLDCLTACAKRIFNSTVCYVFVENARTGELGTFLDSAEMQIVLKGSQNLVAEAMEAQKVRIYTDPLKCERYSSSVDPLFNPESKPVILIPIGKVALLFVVHTDPITFCYTNEDAAVGAFLSQLVTPLVYYHLQFAAVRLDMKERLALSDFQMELTRKSNFFDLLPFLSEGLEKIVGARQTRIFFVSESEYFRYEIGNNQLVQRRYPPGGTIKHIRDTLDYVVVPKLHPISVPAFSEDIDGVHAHQSFGGFPLQRRDGTVVAVLCVSDRNDQQPFREKDIDSLLTISPLLALVIERCFATELLTTSEQMVARLREFPMRITQITDVISAPGDHDSEEMFLAVASQALLHVQAEYIAVYDKDGICLASLKGDSNKYEGLVVSADFARKLMADESTLNIIDATRHPGYSVVPARSILGVAHNGIGMIAVNHLGKLGRFTQVHELVLQAYCSIYVLTLEIHRRKKEHRNKTTEKTTLQSIIDISEEANKAELPCCELMKAIGTACDTTEYCILRYVRIGEYYDILLSSWEGAEGLIQETDPLIRKIDGKQDLFTVQAAELEESVAKDIFPKVEHFVLIPFGKRDLVLVLCGNEVPHTYDVLLPPMLPLLGTFVDNYLICCKPTAMFVHEMNRIDFRNSSVQLDDLAAFDFDVTLFSETQQVEALLHLFVHHGFLDLFKINLVELTEFVMALQKSYNAIPYHNWQHAISVTQFVQLLLVKGELASIFSPIELAALLFAALSHDIGHSGVSSTAHVKSESAASFIYGIQSTFERFQCYQASKLLQRSAMGKALTDNSFWRLFSDAILSTDVTRIPEIVTKFSEISPSFTKDNPSHKNILSQIIIALSNVSNCFRSFDYALKMANALEQERPLEIEYLKTHVTTDRPGFTPLPPLPEREATFITTSVLPLATALDPFCPALELSKRANEAQTRWTNFKDDTP